MSAEAREQAAEKKKISLSFTVEPTTLKITSEPFVVLTARGYAPVVNAEVDGEPEQRVMFISASSFSNALEEFRSENNGNFTGIHITVRKESADRFAKYIVEAAK